MSHKKLPRGFIENLRTRKPIRLTAEQEKLLRSIQKEYPDDELLKNTFNRYLNSGEIGKKRT